MSLWVLDTDTVTLLQQGQASVCQRAAAHTPQELAISIVTVEEMLGGWYAQIRRARSDAHLIRAYAALQQAVAFANQVQVLALDSKEMQQFRRLQSVPVRIGTNDLLIAATVLENQAVLVTRNHADFRKVPGLLIENWA